MPSPTLTITLTASALCDDVTIKDTTADYGAGTETINSVKTVIIVVTISGGSYLTFTFTVLNGVITAATLGLSGATPTSIFTSLASTVWPFVATPFSIWRAYGVTVPKFADSVVAVDYTIKGVDINTPFAAYNFITSAAIMVPCVTVCCCVNKLGLKVDPDCDCTDCIMNYILADTYLSLANMNTQIGNTDRALLFIAKATALCNCTC